MMRRARGFPSFPAALARNAAGNLSVEFALIVPILTLLSFGALELGNILLQHLRMASAARAGLQYGLQDDATAMDEDGMARAARAGAGRISGSYSVTSRKFCSCTAGEVSCGTSCSDGSDVRAYVEVAVEGDVSPLISYPIPVTSWHLAARQVQRLN